MADSPRDPREATRSFYDDLASDYHLIFADWDASVRRQGQWIVGLLGPGAHRVLDFACGIGTQAIGLALLGHDVVARDLSPGQVARAREGALRFGVEIDVEVGDMCEARPADRGRFDAVVAFDNAIPHLDSDADIAAALGAARAALAPGGVYLASIRDYDRLLEQRPRFDPPRLLGEGPERRIVLQHWTWTDERRYDFDLIILVPDAELGWRPRVRRSSYRAVRRDELTRLAIDAGFAEVEWLVPEVPVGGGASGHAVVRARTSRDETVGSRDVGG